MFSDLCGGAVLGLDRQDERVVVTDLVEAPGIVSFAVDLDGELYVVGTEGIEKIVAD